ncbi:MAG: hypothetical protein GXP15_08530 [Gammaproteobacteria bacterium]|nr:hypothetical protein [Gammaproteobacteria bacterium]
MRELACEFGVDGRLKGVLSIPTTNRRPGLAVVLVSAGFTSKVGPYRLYTELARTVAEMGLVTLRFDLGGIGDSQILKPDQSLKIRTEADIREALNYLRDDHNIGEILIGGLCSGAEDAFRFAEEDTRVVGVVLIDPHAYRTKWWWVRNLFSRYCFNRVLYKVLRMLRVINIPKDDSGNTDLEGFEGDLINYHYMAKEESTRILQVLIQRNVALHYIYTGGRTEQFNHTGQFKRMFDGVDLRSGLVLDYLPHIGHVQVFEKDRAELISTIAGRIRESHLNCQ